MAKLLPGKDVDCELYAITDSKLSLGRDIYTVTKALLESGIKIIQYREKNKYAGEMLEECRIMRKLTQEYNACFIVNDHIDIAMICGADGVHIGQDDLPVNEVRSLVGDMIIGLSTHSEAQAKEALSLGVDYIGVGPIYATKTKVDVMDPVGLGYLDYVVKNIDLPYVAIGGIKKHNINEVVSHGAKCCALVSEFVGAEDIGAMVKSVRAQMKI